jgi:pimeloyl-ACP methyl ester carboxylesterase
MLASVHLDRGAGPAVVLLHGVGAGPGSFAAIVERLADDHRCLVIERPGRGLDHAVALDDQADAVARVLGEVGGVGARLVGVSGGATLGLLLGIRHPHLFADLVLHEPLVGPLAPALHDRFRGAADRAAASPEDALAVARSVMGERAWDALGDEGRAAAVADAPRWQGEIAAFAGFAPTRIELSGLRSSGLVVTLGAESGPERAEAALVLQDVADATIARIPGTTNAPHLEAPDAFAGVLRSLRPAALGGPR